MEPLEDEAVLLGEEIADNVVEFRLTELGMKDVVKVLE